MVRECRTALCVPYQLDVRYWPNHPIGRRGAIISCPRHGEIFSQRVRTGEGVRGVLDVLAQFIYSPLRPGSYGDSAPSVTYKKRLKSGKRVTESATTRTQVVIFSAFAAMRRMMRYYSAWTRTRHASRLGGTLSQYRQKVYIPIETIFYVLKLCRIHIFFQVSFYSKSSIILSRDTPRQ